MVRYDDVFVGKVVDVDSRMSGICADSNREKLTFELNIRTPIEK